MTLLLLGAKGEAVKTLQVQLNAANAHMPTLPHLKVDGDFGPLTDARVRFFQKQRGLEVDGKVGQQTWAALRGDVATPATTNGGLMIAGKLVPVEGCHIIGPHQEPWAHLSPGDCKPRTTYPQQWMNHKTIADDPEYLLAGRGATGGAQRTAEYWQEDPRHSGAHGVTGHDAIASCLGDVVLDEAYHGNYACPYSVGWEQCELPGGGFFKEAGLATVRITLAGCRAIGIQYQMPKRGSYTGHPIPRYTFGGPDMVGIFGHRDTTEDRNRHDPGNWIFGQLAAHGVEEFDFHRGEDLEVWRGRQVELSKLGLYKGAIDGVAGRLTTAACKAAGYRDGIWALGKAAA